jgi:hypothetical protein
MFYICRLDDEGNWQGLRSTTEEDYADKLHDYFSELYPHAYIVVLTHAEFHGNNDSIDRHNEWLTDQYFLGLETEGEHEQQQQSIRYEQIAS